MPRVRHHGLAALEFALVLPLVVMLVFGMVEYGWVFYQQFNVASAVRQGVRKGVTVAMVASPDPLAQAKTATESALAAAGIDPSLASTTAAYSGPPGSVLMTVASSVPYQPIIGLLPAPGHVLYSMTMMMEQQ